MTIHKISATIAKGGNEYILSTADVDRYSDIVVQNWKLDKFRQNPIALAYHDSRFPIGRWEDVAVKGGQLRGRLVLAPPNTSARCNEIRRLVAANVLRGVSVGFTSARSEPLDNGGMRYLENELVECSLVSLPANANALLAAKAAEAPPGPQRDPGGA
jgi:HK97 family phage prohead protease